MPGLTLFQMKLRHLRLTTPVYEEGQLAEGFSITDKQRAEVEEIRKQDIRDRIMDFKRARLAVNRAREASTAADLETIIEEPTLDSIVPEAISQP